MDKAFKISERRFKGGKVTVVEHRNTGFRTLVLSGRCSTIRSAALSNKVPAVLRGVGRDFLHSFPTTFLQKDFITTFDPNASYRKTKNVSLEYEFQFVIADNIPTNEALQSVLQKNEEVGELISQKIKKIEAEYGDGK